MAIIFKILLYILRTLLPYKSIIWAALSTSNLVCSISILDSAMSACIVPWAARGLPNATLFCVWKRYCPFILRKDMYVKVHVKLSNFRHKLNYGTIHYCSSTFLRVVSTLMELKTKSILPAIHQFDYDLIDALSWQN